jgi:translation initiation factor 1A
VIFIRNNDVAEENTSLMVPRNGEVVGTVAKIEGASRFLVSCTDGKDRLCSIPRKFKRKFWIKVNDVVLVKPWIVQGDERGDIIWRYSLLDISKLKDRKILV